jgi:inner membrane protein
MDNVTHALHGLALYALAATDPAVAGDPIAMSAVLWAASLGSQAPDFDFVIRIFFGDVAYLKHHRGISHSIPAWFVWPTFLAGVLWLFFPGYYGLLWWWSFWGVVVHVGMDLLTTYGTAAFWPLSKRRYGWDILMIVDLVLWALGALGIWLWVTGREPERVLQYTVVPALLYLLLRVGVQLYLRWRVKSFYKKAGVDIGRISVIPFLGLFRWNLVVESEEKYELGTAHLRKGISIQNTYQRRWDQQALQELEKSHVFQVFRWFARHLFLEVKRDEQGHLKADLADLTFGFSDRIPLTAHITLDAEGKVIEERVGRKHDKFRKIDKTKKDHGSTE